jgi:hypothetical protein
MKTFKEELKNLTPDELWTLSNDIEDEMSTRLVQLLQSEGKLEACSSLMRHRFDRKYNTIVDEYLDHIELDNLSPDFPTPILVWHRETDAPPEQEDVERREVFNIKHMFYVAQLLKGIELAHKHEQRSKQCAEGLDFDHEDIVITDPCYFHVDAKPEKMIQRDTIYGDWSCSVFAEYDEPEIIGEFCADSGMVCVAALKDVLKISPEFENWAKEHDWCATIIRNYTGHVVIIERKEGGDSACVVVEGKGPELNFITAQTGL